MEFAPNSHLQRNREPERTTRCESGLEYPATTVTWNGWIVGAALLALLVKLTIAYDTFGTNDVASFYMFARSLHDHGLEWTYQNGVVFFSNFPIFNHPPLTAYYLVFIETASRSEFFRRAGITFPFLLRLPGIVADFITVIILLKVCQRTAFLRVPAWAMLLFALSPVSLMVSGFHGNTDPIMVLFIVLSAWMGLRKDAVWCAIFLALSCQVKIVPLLLLPIFFFFWISRNGARKFAIAFLLVTLVMWIQPLIGFPMLFLRNVFTYSSYWGGWGITYWLRLTHLAQFNGASPFHLAPVAAATSLALKCFIVMAVLLLGWRRRLLPEYTLIDSIAYAWIIFFVFSPGISVQYTVWLAPFILFLSPKLYLCLTATTSVFLFAFYNVCAGGLPWYLAVSRSNPEQTSLWLPWSLWPWATLIFGMILTWRKLSAADLSFRLAGTDALTTHDTSA